MRIKSRKSIEHGGCKKWIFRTVRWMSLASLLLIIAPLRAQTQWTPVWSDEFNGSAGSFPDPSNWVYDVGGGGWGNGEWQVYCAPGSDQAPCSAANPNVSMDGDGSLVIHAMRSPSGTWTSTRMKTAGLREFQYGRIEARIKLTAGNGLWPAFWMLGTNIPVTGWPSCGEADIMEWVGPYTPNSTSATAHGPGYSGSGGIGDRFFFPDGGRIDDLDYHVYGVVWSPYKLEFYRDDWTNSFLRVTPTSIRYGNQWVFNHPFFLLLNQAVGSNWFPGPDGTTPDPADMLVDYVRVFTWSDGPPAPPGQVQARSNASNQIELSWEGTPDASVTYDIYASTAADFEPAFSNLVVQGYRGMRYVHQGLEPDTTYYYQVRAANAAGESVSSNEASATTLPFGNGAGIAIIAGSYAVGNFASEMFVVGGSVNSHRKVIDTSEVIDPAPQEVYQSEHWGASEWDIPNLTPGAAYTLRLHFAENTFSAPGRRLFGVVVNGEQVLTHFDIFGTAGAMGKAVVQSFTVTADDSGVLTIQFVPGTANQPSVSGIELIPMH